MIIKPTRRRRAARYRQRAGRRRHPRTGEVSRSGLRGNTATVRPRTPPTSVSLAPRRSVCTSLVVVARALQRVLVLARARRQFSRVLRAPSTVRLVLVFFSVSLYISFVFTTELRSARVSACLHARWFRKKSYFFRSRLKKKKTKQYRRVDFAGSQDLINTARPQAAYSVPGKILYAKHCSVIVQHNNYSIVS